MKTVIISTITILLRCKKETYYNKNFANKISISRNLLEWINCHWQRQVYWNPAFLFLKHSLIWKSTLYQGKNLQTFLIRIPSIRLDFRRRDTDLWEISELAGECLPHITLVQTKALTLREETMTVECWPSIGVWKRGGKGGNQNAFLTVCPHPLKGTLWCLLKVHYQLVQITTFWNRPYLYRMMPNGQRKHALLCLQPLPWPQVLS